MEPVYEMTLEEAYSLVQAASTKSIVLGAIIGYVENLHDAEQSRLTSFPFGTTTEEYHYHRGRKEAFQTLLASILMEAEDVVDRHTKQIADQ